MNVTILWTQWSGYMDACARSLVEELGCSLSVFYLRESNAAPFEKSGFFKDYPVVARDWDVSIESSLEAEITASRVDIILICSWHIPLYRRVAKNLRGRATRVLCMDNQWLGTIKQRVGSAVSSWYVLPLYDFAFVPGSRQKDFALRLGFAESRIVTGHYSCDTGAFLPAYEERTESPLSRSFLFVGRVVREKGIEVLKAAWLRYLAVTDDPWRLRVTGAGDMKHELDGIPFLSTHDFVQPHDLPAMMLQGDVFVLPSTYEPWGLVIHEAAATGMPIICSDACGAADAFVRDGDNGRVCRAGSADALFEAFREMGGMPESSLRQMGEKSFRLASARTPRVWAEAVMSMHNMHEMPAVHV